MKPKTSHYFLPNKGTSPNWRQHLRLWVGLIISMGGVWALCHQFWLYAQDHPVVLQALVGGSIAALATAECPDFRTITSDALQGVAAAKFAIDSGMKKIVIIHQNNDFGVNLVKEFTGPYTALGGTVISVTPYNAKQSSYASEVTAAA